MFTGKLDRCGGLLQDPGGGSYRGKVYCARVRRARRFQHGPQVPRYEVITKVLNETGGRVEACMLQCCIFFNIASLQWKPIPTNVELHQ